MIISKNFNDNEIKVINELMDNARLTNLEISKKTGLSRQTVTKIINKLENEKKIWGYTPIVDFKSFGKNLYIILIKSKGGLDFEKTTKSINVSQKMVTDIKSLMLLYSGLTHGEFDAVVLVSADNIVEVKKFLNYWKAGHKDEVEEVVILEELINIRFGRILNPGYVERLKDLL
jgi:DNA-binding Lrp family transcriptional regulator